MAERAARRCRSWPSSPERFASLAQPVRLRAVRLHPYRRSPRWRPHRRGSPSCPRRLLRPRYRPRRGSRPSRSRSSRSRASCPRWWPRRWGRRRRNRYGWRRTGPGARRRFIARSGGACCLRGGASSSVPVVSPPTPRRGWMRLASTMWVIPGSRRKSRPP